MKIIPLTRGYFTIVDDEDYAFLNQWGWSAVTAHGYIYAVRTSRKSEGKPRCIRMHRAICGTRDGFETDHKNGNTLDNRRGNLREATRIQNMRNRALNKNNTSGHKGVVWVPHKPTVIGQMWSSANSTESNHDGHFSDDRA